MSFFRDERSADSGVAGMPRASGAAGGTGAAPGDVPRWRRRLRRIGALLIALALLASPWWGRALLQQLDFFRVRRVEIQGARYAAPDEIVSRLRVDTTASVWDDVSPLEARVREHPQVSEVRIRRKLPGTLVVVIEENPPVALVGSRERNDGLVVTDASGATLPVDPTIIDVDLPVLVQRDTLLLRLLGAVREANPALFARVSEAGRTTKGDVVLVLPEHRILAGPDVTAALLAYVMPVEIDLARRDVRVAELDLRFRDQVIARQPRTTTP